MSDPGHPMGLWLWLELPVSHMLSNIYGLASKQPHHLPHHELQKLFAADEAGIPRDCFNLTINGFSWKGETDQNEQLKAVLNMMLHWLRGLYNRLGKARVDYSCWLDAMSFF